MSYIFFSYSRKNTTEAREIVDGLRAVGFIVWQDVSNIPGGSDWQAEIQKGISGATALVVLCTQIANESKWVREEIRLARAKDVPIIPLTIDDTDLPDDLVTTNAIPLQGDLNPVIEAIVLIDDIRRRTMSIDWETPLDEQGLETTTWSVEGQSLVKTLLMQSSYCAAWLVAPKGVAVNQPEAVNLALDFTQDKDEVLVSEMYRLYRHEEHREPFIALHITGPVNYQGIYRLNNDNPAQWLDAVDTVAEAVKHLKRTKRPLLRVVNRAPATLTFAIGMQFYRFWRVQLYNYVGDNQTPRYKRVIGILSEK